MELGIVSLNVAGWAWRLTEERWKDRLLRACQYIKKRAQNAFVIGLQEVQLGGGKYLDVIKTQFHDYEVILPNGYNNQPKSVVSLLLLNRKMYKECIPMTFNELEDNLRYNFVNVSMPYPYGENDLCFRIVNVHVPHLCNDDRPLWYQERREEMRELFECRLIEEAKVYKKEQDIKYIVLGDFNATPEDDLMQSLIDGNDKPMIEPVPRLQKNRSTWKNTLIGSEGRLDYILYSLGMLADTIVTASITEVDTTPISDGISDHAMLIGGIAIA